MITTFIALPSHTGCHNSRNHDCIIDNDDFFFKTWFVLAYAYASFKLLDYIDMFDFVDFTKSDYAHWNVDITPFSISDFLGADAAFRLLVWQLNTCSVRLRLADYFTASTTTLCSTCASCIA